MYQDIRKMKGETLMTSEVKLNWKEVVHPAIVKYMAPNAQFKNGVPNIAAITRAAIAADNSGEYNEPRVFTNAEIQRQVGLVHPGGTPIACINWYRNNPGPRKTTPRMSFKEAYKMFKENGKSIPQEDLAKIAEANLHIIFAARGADLTVLSQYPIMEEFKEAMEIKHQKMREEKCAKARAARDAKAAEREAIEAAKAEKNKETSNKIKKLKAKKK